MNSSVYLIAALLACICAVCSAQMKCYECSYVDSNPKDSMCWKNVAEDLTATEVDCETYCYSSTFQSGGPNDDANYWYIKRGCSDNDKKECSDSDNCKNDAWGACKTCCSSDKCNSDAPSGSSIIRASIVMVLLVAPLAKWLY